MDQVLMFGGLTKKNAVYGFLGAASASTIAEAQANADEAQKALADCLGKPGADCTDLGVQAGNAQATLNKLKGAPAGGAAKGGSPGGGSPSSVSSDDLLEGTTKVLRALATLAGKVADAKTAEQQAAAAGDMAKAAQYQADAAKYQAQITALQQGQSASSSHTLAYVTAGASVLGLIGGAIFLFRRTPARA